MLGVWFSLAMAAAPADTGFLVRAVRSYRADPGGTQAGGTDGPQGGGWGRAPDRATGDRELGRRCPTGFGPPLNWMGWPRCGRPRSWWTPRWPMRRRPCRMKPNFGGLGAGALDQAFAPLSVIARPDQLAGWPARGSDDDKRAFLAAF